MLGIEFRLTTDAGESFKTGEPLINYSTHPVNNSLKITPHSLLMEECITIQDIKIVGDWEGYPVFFQTPDGNIPFDIFAASFFLVSRYEEYLPFTPDQHGRFPAAASIAFKHHFHKLPIVNVWIKKLGEKLKALFPVLDIKHLPFKYLPTIDIDNPWKLLNKPFLLRNLSIIKSIIYFDFSSALEKIKILNEKLPDSFETYGELDKMHLGKKEEILLFILSSSATNFDMKINPDNANWQRLIKELSEKYPLGLHPSYSTFHDESILMDEKKFLESLCGKSITRSRQHFIRLRMPDTYRKLTKAGIKEDYSMGFHDVAGFRAGIACPFRFFDIQMNKQEDLIIYPFAVMDRTLKDYMVLNTNLAFEEIQDIIGEVKTSGGLFISVWHNESLGDYGEWKGWKDVYIKMNKYLKSLLNDSLP